ncbi:MAG: hypothetical protein ACXABO_16485 [Promethearchaeota archaeon]|jgi:hypothetical protein
MTLESKEAQRLYLFYFDQVEGPKLFFSKHKTIPFDNIILDMLLSYAGGDKPFPIAFEAFQTLNYRFYIPSKFARSGFEEFLITFLVDNHSTENVKSLKLKSQIFKEFAHELKNLKDFPKILEEKRKSRKHIEQMGYNKFKNNLLEMYNKYYERLNLLSAGKPSKEMISKLKIKIKSEILIFIIHACLFRTNVLVLVNKEKAFIISELNNFINYIFQNSFTGDVIIKSKPHYKKNRLLYEGYIVIDERKLINETRNLVNSNQLKYETEIVRNFYNNNDSDSCILDLKERLEGIYILTKLIYNFYEREGDGKIFTPKIVMKHLEESLSVKKIRKQYLYFLTDIIRAYFGLNIIWRWDQLGEKIDDLWK